MTKNTTKFLIVSEFGELLDLAIHLQDVEKQEVLFHVPDAQYRSIGKGIVETTDDSMIQIGKGYTWIFDGCARGKRQDWLRSKGESVFGGTALSDKLENNRQAGQSLFKSAGFLQVPSKNFKSLDDATSFVKENKDKRYILKQNGDAPKSLNHMGKFDDSEDMLYHLSELKTKWRESEMGAVDFDLMEVVEGLEVAASAFFNGKDFLRNKDGKVVGFINFEEKKEIDGGLGETTGEMGTTFIGVTEDNTLFKDIMLRPKVINFLRDIGYRGVFDINCIKTKEGVVALEPTCRFGIPATSYEFMEGLQTPTHELIEAVAKGKSAIVDVHEGIGMVMVVAAKPFPLESHTEESSIGEKLWILDGGKPTKDFTPEQLKHIHLENFEKDEDGYKVASSSGYLFTVTGRLGKTITDVRDNLIQYIKDNVYISGMKYRSDIGQRVEEASGTLKASTESKEKMRQKYEKEMESIKNTIGARLSNREKALEDKKNQEVEEQKNALKSALRKAIYG